MSDAPIKARAINDTIRYTCWAVFCRAGGLLETGRLSEAVEELAAAGVEIRGWYDVSAMRADADVMVWLHGPSAEAVQAAVRRLRAILDAVAMPQWSAMALHRPAEFNKGHVPNFMTGRPADEWLCVYPFVRSLEWYLLPEAERRTMLIDHGMMGRDYPRVRTNTVAAFALGDYEWILALEGPDLAEIVDLMRHLRGSEARRHVRVETPMFTGRAIGIDEVAEVLA